MMALSSSPTQSHKKKYTDDGKPFLLDYILTLLYRLSLEGDSKFMGKNDSNIKNIG
jgi:hypothetical protein